MVGLPAVAAMLGAASGGGRFAYVAFWLAAVAIVVWALFDASGQPREAWLVVGTNRTALLSVLVGGAFFCGFVGYVAAIFYFATIRPRLRAAV